MSRFTINAFVIRSIRVTESSRMLTLFSREMGKVKGVAKGAGRPKSKLGGKIELFNLIEGDLYKKETSELGVLSGAALIDDFKGLSNDPRKFGFASAWCEVLDKMTQLEEPHIETFELTHDYFRTLQKITSQSSGLIFWSVIMKLLVLEGYGPGLERCSSCGKEIDSDKAMLSLQRGGLICSDCVEYDEPVVTVTRDILGLLKLMESAQLLEIAEQTIETRKGRQAAEVILSLASYHLGLPRNLKSFKFLENLTDLGR
jgi:DNA repair protein RecO (recombination protein O)